MPTLKTEDWGLIDFERALKKQLEYLDKVAENPSLGFLIFCSHPPVVTLGRKTEPEDVFAWQGPLLEISRGGRATYHGPSQVVIYPILQVKDIHRFIRVLEQCLIMSLNQFDIPCRTVPGQTGVWVGSKKIASIGIAVKKWISYHGAALNLYQDSQAYFGMKPCGLNSAVMTSAEEILNFKIDRIALQFEIEKNFSYLWSQSSLSCLSQSAN